MKYKYNFFLCYKIHLDRCSVLYMILMIFYFLLLGFSIIDLNLSLYNLFIYFFKLIIIYIYKDEEYSILL